MAQRSTHFFSLSFNHSSTPVELRERLALDGDRRHALYEHVRETGTPLEWLILNTCNRIEFYGACRRMPSLSMLSERLRHVYDADTMAEAMPHAELLRDETALSHLFQVAAGLDSQMVGETRITAQLKQAYAEAIEAGTVDSVLHRLVQKSFRATKWARTHTGINSGSTSLGYVTSELATRVFGSLEHASALVVGAGSVGSKIAQALRDRGIGKLRVTSRHLERAEELGAVVDAEALPFESWKEHLSAFDVVVLSTASPIVLLHAAEVLTAQKRRRGRAQLLVDLAMPRNIAPDAGAISETFLYGLEDLARIANENLAARQEAISQCRRGMEQRAERLWKQIARIPTTGRYVSDWQTSTSIP